MCDQQNSEINENNKYLYDKAIEGRQFHMECFNHWMNMYAIFNGALLVAFTALSKVDNEFFIILITLLGIITSALWCFSVHGYYDWIISWINVVSFYETKLENESVYIYRLFAKTKPKFPFSTQKCTQCFTMCVLNSWIFTFLYQLISVFKSKDISIREWICENVCILILLILFITACLYIFCFQNLRENLTKTHKNLTEIRTSNSRRLNSELQDICDFEEEQQEN